MSKSGLSADLSEQDTRAAAEAAQLVQRDFDALLAVFDQQLAHLPLGETERRAHIEEAKAAAQRGIALSKQLSELLSRPS